MDNELFELCKEVYKRTGWKDVVFSREEGTFQVIKYSRADYKMHIGLMDSDESIEDFQEAYPLYTSDYLLEKLPPTIVARGEAFSTATRVKANAPVIGEEADTPLKALLKLVLALDDAGVKVK